MAIGARLTWLIYIFMALTFVISFPISAILDKVLGEEVGSTLSKNRMKKLFEKYAKDKIMDDNVARRLSAALDLQDKTAEGVMTPLSSTFMIDINRKLDAYLLREIYQKGYSRIPIYENSKENIVGILMARDLILINPE
jgi:metal transporter CNNM